MQRYGTVDIWCKIYDSKLSTTKQNLWTCLVSLSDLSNIEMDTKIWLICNFHEDLPSTPGSRSFWTLLVEHGTTPRNTSNKAGSGKARLHLWQFVTLCELDNHFFLTFKSSGKWPCSIYIYIYIYVKWPEGNFWEPWQWKTLEQFLFFYNTSMIIKMGDPRTKHSNHLLNAFDHSK